MKDLNWYTWLLFALVSIVALAISWWSMFTLGVENFHMPVILAGSVSAAFDLGAVLLALVAMKYATSGDSGLSTEIYALIFMGVSAWINGYHAHVLNFGIVGIVMFAAAPVISAIVLKVILKYLNKQTLRSHGRTVRHLPVAGKLTWILKPKQSFSLLMLAMQDRLQSAWLSHVLHDETNVKDIEIAMDKQNAKARFGETRQISTKTRETKAETPEIAVRQVENESEIELFSEVDKIAEDLKNTRVAIPSYLNETMSTREIARQCYSNGITEADEVFKYVNALNDNEVSLGTVRKAVSAAKMKALKG
jgi:hypothetical protein